VISEAGIANSWLRRRLKKKSPLGKDEMATTRETSSNRKLCAASFVSSAFKLLEISVEKLFAGRACRIIIVTMPNFA